MSPKLTKPRPPQPACYEDVDEARGTPVPGTKVSASANVGVKRSSKENLDERALVVADMGRGGGSVAGDSGYSSQAATVASTSPKTPDDYFVERKPKKSDSTRRRTEEKKRPEEKQRSDEKKRTESRTESRTERPRRRTSSQAAVERSKSKPRRDSGSCHDPNCKDCKPRDKGQSDRSSRRYSKEIADGLAKQPKVIAPSQTQPRPRPERAQTISQPLSRPRPISVEISGVFSNGIYQAPPSAWLYQGQTYVTPPPPQPHFAIAPPSVIPRVSTVPYSHQPVAEAPSPLPPQVIRRQSVSSGQPIYQHISYTPTVPSVHYSTAPIQDTRVPAHRYSIDSHEAAYRRQQEHEAQLQARRAAEAARAMPPPTRRPSISRSRSTSTQIHHYPSNQAPRRDPEPPSPTKRPTSRTSASYHSTTSRRSSGVNPMVRSTTVQGHERSYDLEGKLYAAENYQERTNINPRMYLRPETVQTQDAVRPSSNAGSHKSRSSRSSGHRTTSSQSNGGITVTTDDYKISVLDAKNQELSIKTSEKGVLLTVHDEAKQRPRSMLISKDADDGRSRDGKSDRRSILSRHSSSSKKTDKSKR